jgi:hypothetical protein
MKGRISLQEAKELSLIRWRKVKADLPFRIYKVKCDNEKGFKYALTNEIRHVAERSGYHRNCKIV